MSLMDRIRSCASYEPSHYVDFYAGGERLGAVHLDNVEKLAPYRDQLTIDEAAISLKPQIDSYSARTQAMAEIANDLRAQGLVPGWRNEAYRVGISFSSPPAFQIERAAVSLFGFKGYGVHMNGFVRDGDQLKLWVAKRSLSKPTGPGKLDQIVAGGQPVGLGLKENLVKECREEANIPAGLAAKARPVGTVSYQMSRPEGFRDDVLFIFDLELPANFKPENTDGEVETFYLWPLDKVRDVLVTGDAFKFNSGLVVIDFMVRHGIIDADEPAYADIVAGLHS